MEYEIGMIGLGVMGRNLVMNMADHGIAVAAYDKSLAQVQLLRNEAGNRSIMADDSLSYFIRSLRTPRAVMMMVPAGPPVDAVIYGLLPHLAPDDVLIDGGNSYFKDTDLRAETLAEKDILYLGVGISGGEHGARFGPSIMPGGPLHAYERVRSIFEAIAARVNGEPCVTYLGPRSAGHYVKIVHNGIEYAMLAAISEAYDLLKRGLGFDDTQLSEIFARWNSGPLNSDLIEITSRIFMQKDQQSGKCLVDVILDEAGQKGTGKWTSEDAMALQVPVLTIDASVAMRNLSMLKQERENASHILTGPTARFEGDRDLFLRQIENALYIAFLATFAQGMTLLRKSSEAYDYDLNLEMIASIWRGGCIIRTALLEDIRAAYHANPNLPNLLVDPHLAQQLNDRQNDLRAVVRTAADLGIPAPALMTSLGYYDGYRSAWLPANLIQAQRDYIGAHSYERIDEKGVFHTAWSADPALGNLDE